MILVDIFHQKSENNKVQRCVREMAELSAVVREYLSRDLGLFNRALTCLALLLQRLERKSAFSGPGWSVFFLPLHLKRR